MNLKRVFKSEVKTEPKAYKWKDARYKYIGNEMSYGDALDITCDKVNELEMRIMELEAGLNALEGHIK